jgi:hypothetical protein
VRVAACCSRGMCLDELSDPAFGSDGRPRPGASGGTQGRFPAPSITLFCGWSVPISNRPLQNQILCAGKAGKA